MTNRPMTAVRIHVMQASLRFSLPRDRKRNVLDEVYARGADVIGHTEAGEPGDSLLLREAAKAHGYQLVHPFTSPRRRATTAIAVRRAAGELLDSYHVATTPGQPGLARHGGHGPRGLTVAEVLIGGNVISFAEFHVVTGWGHGDDDREAKVLDQWRLSTKVAARLGRGTDLAVLMGDVNYDPDDPSPDTPSRILEAAGWTSALDEADKPDLPTHGRRTIDQLYTLDSDRRVTVKRVRRWTARPLDHAQVSAVLEVAPRRAAR